jgi:large subunit ribosomal protein L31
MKANIHPKWHKQTKVVCACGNTFVTSSTQDEIRVEVCSACHPFFTGQQKFVDTLGMVDKFQKRKAAAVSDLVSKKKRKLLRKQEASKEDEKKPRTLKEMLSQKS